MDKSTATSPWAVALVVGALGAAFFTYRLVQAGVHQARGRGDREKVTAPHTETPAGRPDVLRCARTNSAKAFAPHPRR